MANCISCTIYAGYSAQSGQRSQTRSDPRRPDSIRSEFHSIRYGIVSCLASVTCTLDIKRRLILIIFLKKNLPSSCHATRCLCSARFGSPKAIKRPAHEFGSFTSRVHPVQYAICLLPCLGCNMIFLCLYITHSIRYSVVREEITIEQ